MRPSRDGILHDTSSLYRFVHLTCQRADQQRVTHLDAAVEFLEYIFAIGSKTQQYLIQDFLPSIQDQIDSDPDTAEIRRQTLVTLRESCFKLHEFIKSVQDAHCLNVPVPLLEFFQQRLRGIKHLNNPRFVTLHTDSLNYLQYPSYRLKEIASLIAAITGGRPFPEGLGLIAIPYSQGSSIFSNLLISHEIGHFVFEELAYEDHLAPHVDLALADVVGDEFYSLPEAELARYRSFVHSWCEEVFCDRFALNLIGPAFSFAYLELFDVIGISNQTNVLDFDAMHPSDACRFKEHKDQLIELRWWDRVSGLRTDYATAISQLADFPESDYRFPTTKPDAHLDSCIKAFLQLRREVKKLVADTCRDLILERFAAVEPDLEPVGRYLSYGVVPSTLVFNGQRRIPHPLAIINASYELYLQSMPSLMGRIEGQDQGNIEHRVLWAQRLEMWTMKALDDLRLQQNVQES